MDLQSRRVSLVERIHNAGEFRDLQSRRVSWVERITILASLGTCRVGDGEFRDLQTAESAKPRGPVRLSSRIGESEVEGPAELVNPVVARIVCT